ncbi:MAG TPA: methylated-DNA--[protein]-cysteine S-methyltransferase [Candidatus Acidoferrum sp.]|nr:methylated-DNA--[protein]-cysteine S-methyltransferase [Candidatus Acidoferrum sp.]
MNARHPGCVAIEADLVAAATGEAAPEATRRVHEHVERCGPCREDFGRYRAIEGLVGRLRATVSDDTEARERLIARLGDLRRRRLRYGVFPSPLGPLLIGRTDDGVSLVQYLGPEGDVRRSLLGRRPEVDAVEDSLAVEAFYRELLEYLEGRRSHLEWPLDLRLARSEFHRGVLRATAAIPYGAVCSYAGIASEIGKPTASRAVAQALRWNPLPIVVPCHRVVGSSGALVGYAGDKVGLKRRLLALEGVMRAEGARVPRATMYVSLPREQCYCLPTCTWIPTADDPHRFFFFGSRERAEAAGLTPCGDCRPDLHPLASS